MTTANASARERALELLKEDHRHVKKHFREFERLDPLRDPKLCLELAQRVCTELEIHARLEEELFYPAAREGLAERDGEDLIDEAEVEHNSLKILIAELRSLTPEDPKFKANFTVLGEYTRHHVKEEEGELFEKLGRSKIDWEALCDDMLERQQELKAAHGLTAANEPHMAEALHAGGHKAGRSSHAAGGAR
jgi:hypothetical protein